MWIMLQWTLASKYLSLYFEFCWIIDPEVELLGHMVILGLAFEDLQKLPTHRL